MAVNLCKDPTLQESPLEGTETQLRSQLNNDCHGLNQKYPTKVIFWGVLRVCVTFEEVGHGWQKNHLL